MGLTIWERHTYKDVMIVLGNIGRVWEYTIKMDGETLAGFGMKTRDEALNEAKSLIDRALVAKEIDV